MGVVELIPLYEKSYGTEEQASQALMLQPCNLSTSEAEARRSHT